MEFFFLSNYGLTPEQVYNLDPDFVDSVKERLRAGKAYKEQQQRKNKNRK